MIKLEIVSTNSAADLRDIVNEKRGDRKTVLEGLLAPVTASYDVYLRHASAGLLPLLNPLLPGSQNEDKRAALLHCYDSPTASMKALRKRIMDAQPSAGQAYCQYCCGLSSSQLTLDHYVPKAEFPEFCVLGENLVPCCSPCNGLRKEWLRDGLRTTLDFYRDPIPAVAFLEARLERAGGGWRPVFAFKPSDGSIINELFQRHCEKLGVLDRITLSATSRLKSIRASAVKRAREGKDRYTYFRTDLADQAAADASVYGPNYWEVVFRLGVSQAEEFLTECYNLAVPS